MKAREGDFVESVEKNIFDVKGLVHPPDRVVAFIRYVPDSDGNRERCGVRFSKFYSLSDRYELLKRKFPQYLVYDPIFNTLLCEVPTKDIIQHYQPAQGVQCLRKRNNLDKAEMVALEFLEILQENARIPWSQLGISGSILVNLHEPLSDIDLIVYGIETGYIVQETMKDLLRDQNGLLKPYNLEGLRELFDFRSKDTKISFEDFVRTDSRKISHGKFKNKHFFIRFVKNLNEICEQYGNKIYRPEGDVKIKATIADDSEALFTPCSYKLTRMKIIDGPKVGPIEEIVSFRGRFCEQAKSGEKVIAQGKLERVEQEGKDDHFRLLLGSKPSDHMILI